MQQLQSAESDLDSQTKLVSTLQDCLDASRKEEDSEIEVTHTHTYPFNGPLSRTTRVSQYQKGKTSLDFTEAQDSEWQWNPLGHMHLAADR